MLTNIRQKIEPWFHWHWRNLQDRRQDRERGRGPDTFPFHGQAWFDLGSTAVSSEWELFSPTVLPAVSLRINAGDGSCVQVHGAVPWLVSIYLTIESRWFRPLPDNFTVASLRWFESTVWWTFWRDDDSWDPSVPRWKSGNLHPGDLLLGRQKYQSKVLSVHDVVVPMPEGPYPAVVTLTEDSWTRQRFGWPIRTIRRADVEMKTPIPFQGKGENSWDCGDDACYSLCCPAENLEEAIGAMVTTVLRDRRRYNGNVMAQYPDPRTVKPKVAVPAQVPEAQVNCSPDQEK